MDLTLGYSPALLAVCLVLAGALAWWSYGRSTPPVAGPKRVLLAGLRFAALFLVLLLVFEPILRRISARDEAPLLAVLVDDSQSLTADGADEALRRALAELPLDAGVRVYRFSSEAEPLAGPPDSVRRALAALRFGGARTDLSGALQRVESDFRGRNLRGVLLLSDGRYTKGRNPAYLAERYPVPIHTAAVGDTTARRDVRIARVLTNEVATVGTAFPVRVGVRATGYARQGATMTVSEGGRVVARIPVALPDDGVEASVELSVVPSAPGLRRFTASVSPLDGEATVRNNSETVAVRVLDARRRLLVLAAAPGPDLTALRATLDADPRLDLVVRTQRAPGQFYEGAIPPSFEGFDGVVLVGYPGTAADEATAQRVATAIERGLPALFLLTRQTDLAGLARHFGDALPAVPATPRASFVEAQPAVTPAGAAHPVLDRVGTEAFSALPPVEASESRWAVAGDARVLANGRRGGVSLGDPLLVVRTRGEGRQAALLGAGTWRWSNLPADLDRFSTFYPSLLENLLRWTTAGEAQRRVRVRPTRRLFGEGEAVTFVGQVYDESLRPIEDAAVRLAISGPGMRRAALSMRPAGNGRFSLDAGTLPTGTYSYTATATRGAEPLGTDAGAFAVGAVEAEFREPGADAALLRLLSRRTGGEVVALSELGSLRDRLRASGRFSPRSIESARSTPLLHYPFLLGLIVLLLSAEWVLRKRSGMV